MSEQPRRPCILVVEDETMLQRILRRMLAGSYRVVTASTLAEAQDVLDHGEPDLLLTDLRLSGGERGELLIERYSARLPCIAMTGFGDRELERTVRGLGAVGYLPKPFTAQSLSEAIEGALHREADDGRQPTVVGLVLSGGGVRGAYEVGVVQGIIEVLGCGPDDPPPFRTFVGTSIGAINATWLAAHAHRGDLDIQGLARIWSSLRYRDLVQVDWSGLLRPNGAGRALLRAGPLADLIANAIDWAALHRNVAEGRARALMMPALDVGSGQSVVFAELAPGVGFSVAQDALRAARPTRITADHVLASAAMPGVFPPTRVDGSYFIDGGLRHNVPIAPAIRAGATDLVVVSSATGEPPPSGEAGAAPGFTYLAGKVMNALLLDPLDRDLQSLGRFNRLLEVLEQELTPEQQERIAEALTASRGLPYRRLSTLVFRPSEDIGALARGVMTKEMGALRLPLLHRVGLGQLLRRPSPTPEADWAAYVLFDGAMAEKLVRMGREDAIERAEEITRFFGR